MLPKENEQDEETAEEGTDKDGKKKKDKANANQKEEASLLKELNNNTAQFTRIMDILHKEDDEMQNTDSDSEDSYEDDNNLTASSHSMLDPAVQKSLQAMHSQSSQSQSAAKESTSSKTSNSNKSQLKR